MKFKKILSITLAVIISLTAFLIPISSGALQATTKTDIDVGAWEIGQFNTDGSEVKWDTHNIRTGYIDLSSYDKVRITRTNAVNGGFHLWWYDESKNFIRRSTSSLVYSADSTYDVEGAYLRIQLYTSAETNVSNGNAISVQAINSVDASLIDASRTGSLSIYKYEMDDISQATNNGTGYDTDILDVPESAKPLEGVTFKITKVAEVSSEYYTVAGKALPTATQAKSMSAIGSPISKTTNSSGYANFTNLPLGIYLVQETNSPSQVTAKVADFVVSIPMTSVSRDSWKYDVTVYPKNQTRYQEITLLKTDYLTGETIQNAKFTLEKSANNSSWSVVETGLTTDENGTISPTNPLGVNTYYRFTETSAPSEYILDNDNKTTTIYINSDGYVCEPVNKTVIDDSNPHLITVTNSKPSIKKYIDKSKGENEDLVEVTSLVRSEDDNFQYYTFEITTPNVEMSKLKTFKVTDTISHTATEPLVVKIVDEHNTTLPQSAYTFTLSTSSDSSSFSKSYQTTLNFDTTKLSKNTTYYVSIKMYIAWATEITNTANLVYSNVTSGSDKTSTTTSNTTKFVPYGYKFTKIDASSKKGLGGSAFSVFRTLEDAQARKNPIVGYNWGSTEPVTVYTTNNTGIFTITGFDLGDTETGEGTFYLVEVKAPTNYNLLAEPIEITVNNSSKETSQLNVANSRKIVLPLTGGLGNILWIALGIYFISLGAVLLVYIRKRKSIKK